ncbi:MAM domain-containing protein 4-like protein, partial [Dinothrombium tinctorium]
RQEEDGVDDESRSTSCDFGSGSQLQWCSWSSSVDTHPNIRWMTGFGAQSYYLGGPLKDHTASDAMGGYAYFETSYKAINRVFSSAALESGFSDYQRKRVAINEDYSIENKTDTRHEHRLSHTTATATSNKLNVYKDPLISASEESRFLIPNVAHLYSSNISRTGPRGYCVSFFYNIDGLSADRLRILVRDIESGQNQTVWESRLISEGKWIKSEIAYSYNEMHQIVLEGIAKSAEEPERAYRGYIAVDDIQITPKGEGDTTLCHGHCTFEGGFCGWTNEEEKDDFDWKEARGSNNFFTGPVRDYYSFSKEYPLGGYIFIDASYPRRPGDKALLISPQFEATGESGPLCFTFATHMYGNGIGTLRVKYRSTESTEESSKDKILWEMSGEAGNYWYVAQLPIASSTAYHIVFEGVIGLNYLGNIAIDNIALERGSCPISPQTASQKSGDCTFEENMCFWTNPLPHANVDDFDWIRQFSFGNYGPRRDHTKRSANGYFLSLSGDPLQPQRGGTLAWIISPEFTPTSTVPKCLSFYYFMYQRVIESGGPSLGGLRVFIRTTDSKGDVVLLPVWRLNNHQSMRWRHAQVSLSMKKGEEYVAPTHSYQVVIEGIWGDARVGSIAIDDINFFDGYCSTLPIYAKAVPNECFFDRNLCNWQNETKRSPNREGQLSASLGQLSVTKSERPIYSARKQGESLTWRLATPTSRPANLQDHTFRAPIGYIFFDVFNQNTLQQPSLRSPKFPPLEGEVTKQCLTFWFSGFGRGDSTSLSVYHVVETGEAAEIGEQPAETTDQTKSKSEIANRVLLWRIQTRLIDTRRPIWHFGQVTVNAEAPYELHFEGEATDGGFAIDDITFYNGTCQTARPLEAVVNVKPEGE